LKFGLELTVNQNVGLTELLAIAKRAQKLNELYTA